ncbi:MAG: universal stress protein [Thermodesulfobacteriota bacterium]|nr:universal stress protein [Thermodesulfobacteriota bacterium]
MKSEETIATTCKLCPLSRHEKILVATDGSRYSEKALDGAVNIARKCGSSLYVLNVVELNPEFMSLAPEAVEKMERDSRTLLEETKERVSQKGITCETVIHEGEQPYEFIVSEAKRKKADLIVIGTHGRTGLKKLLMGSVAARVIGHAPCPVMVIPLRGSVGLKNILVATDGSIYAEAAVKEAISIAAACDSKLSAVCVVKGQRPTKYTSEAEKIVERVVKGAAKSNIQAEGIVREGEPYEVIADLAREKKVDIIIMGRYGRTGLTKLLMGSVTKRVIGHASCAVLVIPGSI